MTIFKMTMKRLFSSKMRVGVMFIGPLLFIVLFVMNISENFKVGIVDEDGTYFSSALFEELGERYVVKDVADEEITLRIAEYQDHYIIRVPEGFEASVIGGDLSDLELESYYNKMTSKTIALEQEINGIIARMVSIGQGAQGDMEKSQSIYAGYRAKSFDIMDTEGAVQVKYKILSAIGFLMQFMLYMSIGTTGIILEDKQSGTYYRTFYAPLTTKRYLFENLLAFITVGFLQVTVVFAFLIGVLDVEGTDYNLVFFAKAYVIMLLFAIVCVALGLFIVNIFKKATVAYTVIGTITSPLVMLGGCYWERSLMPESMQLVGEFLPTTWAMDGIRTIVRTTSFQQVLPNVGILILFIAFFFALGLFKKVDVAH